MTTDEKQKVLKRKVQKGDKFTFKIKVGDQLKEVVGEVEQKMSSQAARLEGHTKSKRGGTFLLMKVKEVPELIGKFRGQVRPYQKEEK